MRQWNKITSDLRPSLEAAARTAGTKLRKQIITLEHDAISAMKSHGLTVHEITPEIENQWATLVREKGYPGFIGPRFSKEMFDKIRKALDEYRKSGS